MLVMFYIYGMISLYHGLGTIPTLPTCFFTVKAQKKIRDNQLNCDLPLLPYHEVEQDNMATITTSLDHQAGPIESATGADISASNTDVEKQNDSPPFEKEASSAFKALGWLDRLLALCILLAMIIGVLLGKFVPSIGPALQKGKFVGVSVPIGT
jgi:hypothetical protein